MFHDLSLDRCELRDRDISQRSYSDNSPFERKDRILKEKEPEKFDGISTDWQDYIISFEQVADWNNWNERERAQQLIMCLKGNAQKLLSECTQTDLQNYQRLKNVLGRRFNPVEREVAFRCEFKSRKREKNESAAEFGYALRRLALKA